MNTYDFVPNTFTIIFNFFFFLHLLLLLFSSPHIGPHVIIAYIFTIQFLVDTFLWRKKSVNIIIIKF